MIPIGPLLEQYRFGKDPTKYVSDVYRDHGTFRPTRTASGRHAFTFAFAPEHNQCIQENPEVFNWAPSTRWTGERGPLGLVRANVASLDGQAYHDRRGLMRPAFQHDVFVGSALATTVAHTAKMLDRWHPGDIADIRSDMLELAQAVAMSVVLGVEEPDEVARITRLVDVIRDNNVPAMLVPIDVPGSPLRKARRAAGEVVKVLRGLIAQKRARTTPPTDMLSLLAHARTNDGKVFSDDELVGEIYNLMGHEDTASTFMWTLLLIALHPDVRRKLVDEAGQACSGASDAPDPQKLPYLEATIKESMRLFPSQCVSRRFNTRRCQLGCCELPENTVIWMSSYITHRIPDIYDKPQRFHPERWDTITPTQWEYFPFGSGVHRCVGRTFAMLEMKVAIAMVLRRYALSLVPDQAIDRERRYAVNLMPHGPLRMKVGRRADFAFTPAVRGDICTSVDLDN